MKYPGKSVLVIDHGIFTELAASLVKDFDNVYYFVNWADAFPSSVKQKIGIDFKGLKRVNSMWDYVDRVDLVVSFDTYFGDLMDYLRTKGYRVWGAGRAEDMELKRWEMRLNQYYEDMPTQATIKLTSIEDLETYLQGIEEQTKEIYGKADPYICDKKWAQLMDKYDGFEKFYIAGDMDTLKKEFYKGAKKKFVKSNTRGDIETFFAPDYHDSISKINALTDKLGHRGDAAEIEFIIEESHDGYEPGFDGIQIDGEYLSPTLWGFEKKGSGYIGRVCDYADLPEHMQVQNKQMGDILKDFTPTRSFMSTEYIIGQDMKPYLIDPTIRNPAPVGSAIYSELYTNLAEIIYEGAAGHVVTPKMYPCKYVAGFCMESDWAQEHELEVEFPKEIERWVKFRKAYQCNGKYYAMPGFTSVVSVIAFGNSIEQVIKLIDERVKLVKGYELSSNHSLLKIKQMIDKIKEDGIIKEKEF